MHTSRNRRAVTARPARTKPAPAAARAPEPALFAPPQPDKPQAVAKKRKPAAIRRKAQRKAKVPGKEPRRGPRMAAAAIALPSLSEPLVESATRPKSRALRLYRPGGIPTALADWIGGQLMALWQQLGKLPMVRAAPRRAATLAQDVELQHLRAENLRLRSQLDMLLDRRTAESTRRNRLQAV